MMKKIISIVTLVSLLSLISSDPLALDFTENEPEVCQIEVANASFSCCAWKWDYYFQGGEVNDNSKCYFSNFEGGNGDENGCRASKHWEASEDSCNDFFSGHFYANWQEFEGKT